MKIIISFLISITVYIAFQVSFAYGELEQKIKISTDRQYTQARYIRSLKNQYNYCLADMKNYHEKKGTNIYEVICLHPKNCLAGNPSVYPIGVGGR